MHTTQLIILLCVLVVSVTCSTSSVVELTSENFHSTVASGAWLVKFYAPWCQHCKKLAPVWEVASHYSKGNNDVKVAKVDCDANSGVCSEAAVEGYPTIKYYVHGLQKNYVGGRKKHDFINFAHKINKPPTVELTSANVAKVLKQENPAFVLVEANNEVRNLFVEIAKHLLELESPDFYELKDKNIAGDQFKDVASGSIVHFRDGDRTVYSGKMEMKELLEWAQHHRFPYVSRYSETTFEALTTSDKLLVLCVSDSVDAEEEKIAAAFKQIAKKRATDFRYLFASLDALQYDKYAASFGATHEVLPTVVVLDQPNEIHYIDPSIKFDSAKKIEQFLQDIEAGNVQWQTWSYAAFISKKVNRFNRFLWTWIQANVALSIGIAVLTSMSVIYVCLPSSAPNTKKTK